jgi:pimeloyl-ACP methyl ester carboxylesterase
LWRRRRLRRRRRQLSVFGLVHGAWHGAWAWERLAPELEVRGHHPVAVELPSDDVSKGLDDYARTVADALGDAEDVVLVAHSLGGLTVPLVPALRPVARIVLVAALVPRPGQSLIDQLRGEDRGILMPGGRSADEDKRTEWTDAALAIEALYHDADPLDAAAAFARLRPQAAKPQIEKTPLTAWPDVPTEYVVCAQDRMVDPEYQRRQPFTLRTLSSGHSPMLSQPAALARLICA